tara:strand:- start:614 stop:1807 length:1194 start_codon:yes stop_codon:yes gene_type:complete
MRLLILSYYFTPDLSAGSFRVRALINSLKMQNVKDLELVVITTHPTRYSSFKPLSKDLEIHDSVTVHRIQVPSHKNGFLDQSFSFIFFASKAFFISKKYKFDVIFATTSKLMTGVLGLSISKSQNSLFYLDIRDLFSDTLKDVFKSRLFLPLHMIIKSIENRLIFSADRINIVSQGFQAYLQQFTDDNKFDIFTNGIDAEFLKKDFTKANKGRKLICLYAGNIGEGQGLEKILPQICKELEDRVAFIIIGSGGREKKLKDSIKNKSISNVTFIPPMPRADLLKFYKKADLLFLHLNDYDCFKKVLPSKIFEYAATKKPIIAGVSGYADTFLTENVDGAFCFPPCNADEALLAFEKASKIPLYRRQSFLKRFERHRIMNELAKKIILIGSKQKSNASR